MPERGPLIPEQDEFPLEIRLLIYFSNRIIFRVEAEAKHVVANRVHYGSLRALGHEDIP